MYEGMENNYLFVFEKMLYRIWVVYMINSP